MTNHNTNVTTVIVGGRRHWGCGTGSLLAFMGACVALGWPLTLPIGGWRWPLWALWLLLIALAWGVGNGLAHGPARLPRDLDPPGWEPRGRHAGPRDSTIPLDHTLL